MATVQVPLTPMCPDSSGNAYATLVAGTNIRALFPAFAKDVDGSWWFKLRVPQDYSSTPHVLLRIGANSAAGQVTSFIVGSIVRDTTAGWDASALTDEAVQDLTMAVVAYDPSDLDFALSTTPAAGKDMLFRIKHNGARAQDTLAVESLLFQAVFQYAT
jgi:hypothetical protein